MYLPGSDIKKFLARDHGPAIYYTLKSFGEGFAILESCGWRPSFSPCECLSFATNFALCKKLKKKKIFPEEAEIQEILQKKTPHFAELWKCRFFAFAHCSKKFGITPKDIDLKVSAERQAEIMNFLKSMDD